MRATLAAAAVLGVLHSVPAAAGVPDSFWSMPLPDGMRAAVARDVQARLKEHGCYGGRIDGIAGKGTARAVREWQGRNGLPRTGVVSEPLVQALLAGASRGCR